MGFWEILATLVFAVGDFIFVEIVAYLIEDNSDFKKSEYFVFGILCFSLLFFYISNLFQDLIVNFLSSFTWWLIPMLIISLGFSILFLAKWVLGRKWSFRLVIIPLIVIILTFLIATAIYFLNGIK